MRCLVLIALAMVVTLETANAAMEILPPLNDQTIVGVWEAVLIRPPASTSLLHLEMSAKGDSYLAQIFVDSADCVLFKLVAADSKVSDGNITLHFQDTSAPPGTHDLWFRGTGSATAKQGFIDCQLGETKVSFLKGSWARDLAEASRAGEKKIQQHRSR